MQPTHRAYRTSKLLAKLQCSHHRQWHLRVTLLDSNFLEQTARGLLRLETAVAGRAHHASMAMTRGLPSIHMRWPKPLRGPLDVIHVPPALGPFVVAALPGLVGAGRTGALGLRVECFLTIVLDRHCEGGRLAAVSTKERALENAERAFKRVQHAHSETGIVDL